MFSKSLTNQIPTDTLVIVPQEHVYDVLGLQVFGAKIKASQFSYIPHFNNRILLAYDRRHRHVVAQNHQQYNEPSMK